MTREEFIQAIAAANPEPLKSKLMQARIATLRASEVDKLKNQYLENLGYSEPELMNKRFHWDRQVTTTVSNETWAKRFCDSIPENAQKTLFNDHDIVQAIDFHHRLEVFLQFPDDIHLSVKPETQKGLPTAKQQAMATKVLITKKITDNLDLAQFTAALIENGEQFIEEKEQWLKENGFPLKIQLTQLKWLIFVTPLVPVSSLSEFFYRKFVAPIITKRLLDDSAIEAVLSSITSESITELLIQLFKQNRSSFKVEIKCDTDLAELSDVDS